MPSPSLTMWGVHATHTHVRSVLNRAEFGNLHWVFSEWGMHALRNAARSLSTVIYQALYWLLDGMPGGRSGCLPALCHCYLGT